MNEQYPTHQQPAGRVYLLVLFLLMTFAGQAKQASAAESPDRVMSTNGHAMGQATEEAGPHSDRSMEMSSAEMLGRGGGMPSHKMDMEETAGKSMGNTAMVHARKPLAPTYACPVHPGEVSDQPGLCSICGRFLVEAKAEPIGSAMPSHGMRGKGRAMPSHRMDHNVGTRQAMGDSAMEHARKHLDPAYVCPMHPEEVSDQPGRCSICDMFLVEAESDGMGSAMDHKAMAGAGHAMPSHSMAPSEAAEAAMEDSPMKHALKHLDPTYACPMHPDEVSDQPGRCRICGMFLVAAGSDGMDETMDHGAMDGSKGAMPSHRMEPSETADQAMGDTPMEHAQKHRDPTYICPMHPQIISDGPSSCPICGMDLVAKTFEPQSSTLPTVTLSPAVVQNMGVRTARAAKGSLRKVIRTQGRVAYDDDRIIQVHPRTPGWIENLYVRTDGVRVERKDDLADYFSPDVLWAQQEYISALEDSEIDSFGSSHAPDPARAFRERSGVDLLKYFKVPSMDIMGLETSMQPRSIIPIRAPQGGVLIEHNVREGTFVTPADNMFTIVDLSEVWVMVDIFEHQLAWIRPGLSAEITSPAYPGRSWRGKLDFVYPEVDPKARTMRARVEVKNHGEMLLPNMFVQVDLSADTHKHKVLMVPREAVIVTGQREVVVKALGSGRFQPAEVSSGLWDEFHAEIITGLDEGDEVVISGQFLIDSESSLQASFLRMSQ